MYFPRFTTFGRGCASRRACTRCAYGSASKSTGEDMRSGRWRAEVDRLKKERRGSGAKREREARQWCAARVVFEGGLWGGGEGVGVGGVAGGGGGDDRQRQSLTDSDRQTYAMLKCMK